MNRGGVRADITAGPVTRGSLFMVAPFGNSLMRITVSGAALRTYLERVVAQRGGAGIHLSGVRVEIDATRSAGERIVQATMSDGSALDDRKTYRLILLDFLADGGEGLGVTGTAHSVESLGILDRDALERYVRSLPQPFRAPRDQRVVQVRR